MQIWKHIKIFGYKIYLTLVRLMFKCSQSELCSIMKVRFITLESGAGDCIFLLLNDDKDGSSYHLMVDCNVLTNEIKDFIKNDLNLRIDTLIVTHLDSDHIKGITKLMREPEFKDLQIGQILFNGFQPQTNNVKPLDSKTKKKLEELAIFLPPIVDEVNHKTSAMDVACLTAELNKHPQWKAVWRKEPILAGNSIKLGKWGCLRFLSPTQEVLDDLLHEVKLEYASLLRMAPPKEAFENQDKYFELMLHLAELRMRPYIPKLIGGIILSEDSIKRYAKEDVNESQVSLPNKASLAFFWESTTNPNKRILMMGDAISSQVLSQLNKISMEDMWFEAIKVSHHGSKNNTSVAINAKVDSNHYFITGGRKGGGPHIETIGKIIMKPIQNKDDYRELHYNHNYPFSIWNELKNGEAKTLLNKYHLKLTTNNIYEFEY